jgi:hypothetical protein
MVTDDIASQSAAPPAVKVFVVVGAAVIALILAKLIFSFVLTLINSAIFLAILAGLVWFGYKLIAGSDDSTT